MLFGSNVLDFAIGLALVYLLLSMICSFVNERITSWLNLRANALIFGLHGMLGVYAEYLLDHPLIVSLGKQSDRAHATPSYIPSQNFFFALIHTILVKDGMSQKIADLKQKIADLDQEAAKLGDKGVRDELLKRIDDLEEQIGSRLSVKTSKKHGRRIPSIRPADVQPRSSAPDGADTTFAERAAPIISDIKVKVQTIQASALGATTQQALSKFVDALEQGVTDTSAVPDVKLENLTDLREAISRVDFPPLRDALLPLVDAAQGNIDRLQIYVEDWFNGAMDRLSGLYKRRTAIIIFSIALVVTVALNGDTFAIGNSLWHNEGQRTTSIAAAQKLLAATTPIPVQPSQTPTAANPGPTPTAVQLSDQSAKSVYDQIKALQVPIGYTTTKPNGGGSAPWFLSDWWKLNFGTDVWDWVFKGVGWIITALALTLGAHFWFDAVGNLMNLRYAGTPPQGKPNAATSGPPSIPPASQGGGGGAGPQAGSTGSSAASP